VAEELMHRGLQHNVRLSAAAIVGAICGLLLPAGPAWGQDNATSAHVSEAVQSLFALDQERVQAVHGALESQDVIRQEVSICIDPSTGLLSGDARIWVESPGDHVRLLLDDNLEVVTVTDSRGDNLKHRRTGGVLVIQAADGAAEFPPEVNVIYEGTLEPGDGALVTGDVVVLGPDFHWYPVSDARDPARLRVEARYPSGYSSVVSGTLAGMAPSLTGDSGCSEGDMWEIPVPVTGAAILVGRLESSLTIIGDVFFGYHGLSPDAEDGTDAATRQSLSSSVPQELIDILRFLETCFGPYPYEWLNVVRLPAGRGRPTTALAAPGLVVVWDAGNGGSPSNMPLSRIVSGLSHSWWTFAADPGRLVSSSLATQAEAEWLEATGDEDGAFALRGLRRAQYARAMRDSDRGIPLRECLGLDAIADDRVCSGKGSAVFEILKSVVGPGAYCSALRTLSSEHSGEPIGIRELVEAFEEEHASDLDWFFYEWVFRSDLPSYAVEYETTPADDGTYLVRGMVLQEGEPFRTPLPLTVDLGGWSYEETVSISSSHQPFEFKADEEPLEVTADDSHLIPRIDRKELAAMHAGLGARAAGSEEWSVAVDEFGAAAALEPLNAPYVHAYAVALVRHGRLADGLAAMDAVIELDPANNGIRMEAAGLYLRAGNAAEALKHLDAYVAAAPDDPVGLVARARALVELARVDEAESSIERARELIGTSDTGKDLDEAFLLATGRIHEMRGETSAAIRAYEAALAVNPVSDEARRRIRALSLPEAE